MNNTNNSIRRAGFSVLFSAVFSGVMLALVKSYYSYAYTDLAGIDPKTMAACLTVVNVVATIFSVGNGSLIQNTRTKQGKYRPWVLGSTIACMIGGFLLFCHLGKGTIATAIIVTLGYGIAQIAYDFAITSRNGIISKMSAGDSEARTTLGARSYQGNYLSSVISGAIVLPLVHFFSKYSNEVNGFRLTQVVLAIMAIGGAYILYAAAKKYDLPNTAEENVKEEKTSLLEMLKSVLINPPALILILCDVVRFSGYFLMIPLMAYQCEYVLNDMNIMTIVFTSYAFCAFLGSTIAPYVCKWVGGRKRLAILMSALSGLSCLGICIFGQTKWGFIGFVCLYFFLSSMIDAVDVIMYIDAGEYWLNKTGKDTRAFNMSVFNLAAKLSMTISGILLGVVLTAINYVPGEALTAQTATTLTWVTGGSVGLGYFLPTFIMLAYKISDEDAERYIKENSEKYN